MNQSSESWSTSQLVGLLAQLGQETSEARAIRVAVQRVLEALDAEVGLLVEADGRETLVGLGPEAGAAPVLLAVAHGGPERVTLSGLGECRARAVRLDGADSAPQLVVARVGTDEFDQDELLLLRGMAWVLYLGLRPLRMVAELAQRQQVLDEVAKVQHSIAVRAALPEVFASVTAALRGLFAADFAGLYLAEKNDLVLASASTAASGPARWAAAGAGPVPAIARLAYAEGEALCSNSFAVESYADEQLLRRGVRAAMAVPVRENGAVVGSIVVLSTDPRLRFAETHQRHLRTFADQVSVALSDSNTLATAQQALRDPVTGLPNRLLFLQRLERAIERTASGVQAHMLFLDLDRFKLVNDTLGHAAGDELLREVGHRLRECLRPTDCLARFGGDEFAVLLEDSTDSTVRKLGDRLLSELKRPYALGAEEVNVSGSIGMAPVPAGGDAGEILRDADTAMYRAKNGGGDQIISFEQSMHTTLVTRMSMEADLRRALDGGELFVVFQPIVDLDSGAVHSAEALVRWRHTGRGVVLPADFIPLAEETSLIVPIGRHVLTLACAEAASWPCPADGAPGPAVSVNVSARQLDDPGLLADIRTALDEAGLPPQRLILEITESTMMADTDGIRQRLQQIRDIGVRLAIDDFGTGYSSLSYLRIFTADILKIDRSFVEGGAAGSHGESFLRTIIRLTDTLGVSAVAEGVETVEQRQVLRDVGCELGQGYLFARPLPGPEFRASLTGQLSSVG